MPEMRLRRWGSLQRSPDPLAGFKGVYFYAKGRRRDGGKGGGKGRTGGEGKGRKEWGREGEGGRFDSHFSLPPPPLHTMTNRENFHFKVSNRFSTTSAGFY